MTGKGWGSAVLVLCMALVTFLLRAAPFFIFRKKVPAYITYLGKVLPPAIIGMLVVYCLKDVRVTAAPFGLPELLAAASVAGIQRWKRNSLASILAGTGIYMILLRFF